MTTARDPLAEIIETSWRECRADGLTIRATADVIAAAVRDVILDRVGEKEAAGLVRPDYVAVQSVVGAATGNAAVQCRVGLEKWQWEPEAARSHALGVLGAAEAAVHDAAMFRWLTLGPIGLDRPAAMQAMVDLRRFRGDIAREDWRPDA